MHRRSFRYPDLGLWPFHAPSNDVAWLKYRDGLRFGEYGTVISSGTFQATGLPDESSCSIEIWLQPAGSSDGGTILAFYHPGKSLRLFLEQSLTDLMLQPETARGARIYIADVFREALPVFVTIASGTQGTAVYLNGMLAMTASQLWLRSTDCTGRLILSDSWSQNTWSGQVRGLAIYYGQLPATTVLRHYNSWTKNGRPQIAGNEHNVALYLFDEHNGNMAHNHARPGLDLAIPDTYTVLDQTLLKPIWEEFNMTWGYWTNLFKNIVGFVPLGFCFYAYFSLVRQYRRAVLVTVIFGAGVSLTIEVLQSYLPTRQSGTTDLITNTLGTYSGILAYRALRVQERLRALVRVGS